MVSQPLFFTHSAADLQWPVLAVSSARPEDFDLLLQLATLYALYVCIQDFVYIHVCNTGSYISSLPKSAAVTTLQLTAVTTHTHKHLPMSTHTCLYANKHSYIFPCRHSSTPHAVGYIASYLHMVQPGVSAFAQSHSVGHVHTTAPHSAHAATQAHPTMSCIGLVILCHAV